MDLFHCNFCFKQPGPPENRKYILGSCGHIFCDVCEAVKDETNCRICQTLIKLLPLNDSIPSNIKIYFSDLIKEIKKNIRVLHIRLKHCKIYMEEYVPQLELKYVSAKAMIEKQNVHIEKMANEMRKLKDEIQILKRENRQIMSTPKTPSRGSCSEQGSAFRLESRGSQIFTKMGGTSHNSTGNFFMSPVESISNSSTPVRTALDVIQSKQGLRGWNTTPKTSTSQIFSLASQQNSAFSNRSSRVPSLSGKWTNPMQSEKRPLVQKNLDMYDSSFRL